MTFLLFIPFAEFAWTNTQRVKLQRRAKIKAKEADLH
jgi:hypothetical protein